MLKLKNTYRGRGVRDTELLSVKQAARMYFTR